MTYINIPILVRTLEISFLRLRISSASDRICMPFLHRGGVPPPHLQRPASRIRPLSAVAPARGLDVEIYDDISKKSCPVSVLTHFLTTGPSDLRPMRGVGCPAGVTIVDACAAGCVLGCERKPGRPEEHMPPTLRRELPSIQISAYICLGGGWGEIMELRIRM